MRIDIPDDVVIGDEIPEPLPGVVIPLMAVRLGWRWTADGRDEPYDGLVEWSRADELNQLFETVFTTSTFKALTQDTAEGRLPEVGDRITLRGTLSCVRSYEFEAFDLPDVRQQWRVTSLLSHDQDGYLIEAEPIPPQGLRARTLPGLLRGS